jgi:predicted phage replisome organizer
MFDGNSFKRIRRAEIGGVKFRDKLTAVWFELLDLAGQSNSDGYLIDNNGVPLNTYEDIATMINRDATEVELCMQFFLKEKMIEINEDVYCVTKFIEYQNADRLEKIREQNRLRQANFKKRKKLLLIGNVTGNVTDSVTKSLPVTQGNAQEKDIDKDIDIDIDNTTTTTTTNIYLSMSEDERIALELRIVDIFAKNNFKSDPYDFIAYNKSRNFIGIGGEDVLEDLPRYIERWERRETEKLGGSR